MFLAPLEPDHLVQGLKTFSTKDQILNILGLASLMASTLTFQICHCSVKPPLQCETSTTKTCVAGRDCGWFANNPDLIHKNLSYLAGISPLTKSRLPLYHIICQKFRPKSSFFLWAHVASDKGTVHALASVCTEGPAPRS